MIRVKVCTATQPCIKPITKSDGSKFTGFNTPYEIIKDTKLLYSSLNRVKIHLPTNKIDTWDEISDRIITHSSALAIFSTRRDAQIMFDLVKEKTTTTVIHLSATMCSTHRTKKLTEVRECLSNNIPIILISTQVVEAGADLDFPVVYRAMAGLDSIAQAAGRCNREGKLEYGEVFLLNTDSKLHPDMIRPKSNTEYVFVDKRFDTTEVIGQNNLNLFFNKRTRQENLDSEQITEDLTPNKVSGFNLIDIKF